MTGGGTWNVTNPPPDLSPEGAFSDESLVDELLGDSDAGVRKVTLLSLAKVGGLSRHSHKVAELAARDPERHLREQAAKLVD